MAAKKFNIFQLWGMHEVTFGIEPDADGSDYKFLKTVGDVTFTPEAEVVERPANTGTLTRQPHVIGPKGGKLSFDLEMKASGTPAVSTVAAIASESSPFLEACLGAVTRGTGSVVAAGSASASSINATSIAGFQVGMMVHFGTATPEIRFVTAVGGGAITLDRALDGGIPANATVITASSMFSRTDDGHKSMAFVGKRDGVEYTFLGCAVTAKLKGVTAKGTALLSVEAMVADWNVTAKASLASSAALSGVTAVKGPVVKGSPFALNGVLRDIAGLEFDPGQQFVYQESTQGLGDTAKADFELVGSKPAGVIRPYYNADHLTDFLAGTEKVLTFASGTSANGWGLYVPKAQWLPPQDENRNGLFGQVLPFAANDNGAVAEYFICQF